MIVFEADHDEYVSRIRRCRALQDELRSGAAVNVAEFTVRWRKLLAEAPRVELSYGIRYRMRVFATDAKLEHKVAVDADTGEAHRIEVLSLEGLGLREIEGVYAGRFDATTPFEGLLGIILDSGKSAAIADIDVLRVERLA